MLARAVPRLLRLSLAPSLVADVVAGAALAEGGPAGIAAALGHALSGSVLLFVGGMALNARVDLEADRRDRPDRPLPSGRISPRVAGILAGAGLVLAAPVAWLTGGPHHGALALAVLAMAAAICLYHTPLRQRSLPGPVLLGSIRGADLLLGAIAVGGAGAIAGPVAWAALLYAAFVTGASLVARQEDRPAGPDRAWVCAGILVAAAAALVAPCAGPLTSNTSPDRWTLAAAVLALAHLALLAPHVRGLGASPRGRDVARLAGQLLSRMPVVLATVCLGGREGLAAGVALLCFAAIRLLVRYIPPT